MSFVSEEQYSSKTVEYSGLLIIVIYHKVLNQNDRYDSTDLFKSLKWDTCIQGSIKDTAYKLFIIY